MKKNLSKFTCAVFAVLTFASCGPTLMTDAEMEKKVTEATATQTTTLTAQLDKECETMMEARVAAKADSIVAVRTTEREAAKAATKK